MLEYMKLAKIGEHTALPRSLVDVYTYSSLEVTLYSLIFTLNSLDDRCFAAVG